MDGYTLSAKKKISSLIRQDDFLTIISISSDYVYLQMLRKSCRIDVFGKVLWVDEK